MDPNGRAFYPGGGAVHYAHAGAAHDREADAEPGQLAEGELPQRRAVRQAERPAWPVGVFEELRVVEAERAGVQGDPAAERGSVLEERRDEAAAPRAADDAREGRAHAVPLEERPTQLALAVLFLQPLELGLDLLWTDREQLGHEPLENVCLRRVLHAGGSCMAHAAQKAGSTAHMP